MSKPRPIEKGATYLLTRRCFQRQFLLVPSALTNQIVTYCLGIATERYGIDVHAFCFMSTHYHIVATDPRGELPEFMRWLNEFIAKSMNARYGRWESFWAPQSYSAVKLVERNDILAKIVYTLQNPVSAGLVAKTDHWPGACSRPDDMLGAIRTIERPKVFFREDGALPATATLRLSSPPALASPKLAIA
ncbi:MAG: transposase [Deltaproteobacteria bacterium]|nr:transposase [Deltaproteobacteria bacterium]